MNEADEKALIIREKGHKRLILFLNEHFLFFDLLTLFKLFFYYFWWFIVCRNLIHFCAFLAFLFNCLKDLFLLFHQHLFSTVRSHIFIVFLLSETFLFFNYFIGLNEFGPHFIFLHFFWSQLRKIFLCMRSYLA